MKNKHASTSARPTIPVTASDKNRKKIFAQNTERIFMYSNRLTIFITNLRT